MRVIPIRYSSGRDTGPDRRPSAAENRVIAATSDVGGLAVAATAGSARTVWSRCC